MRGPSTSHLPDRKMLSSASVAAAVQAEAPWRAHSPFLLRSMHPFDSHKVVLHQPLRTGRHGRGIRPPDTSARRTAPLQGNRGAVSRDINVGGRLAVSWSDIAVRSGGLTGCVQTILLSEVARPGPPRGAGQRCLKASLDRLLWCACRTNSCVRPVLV